MKAAQLPPDDRVLRADNCAPKKETLRITSKEFKMSTKSRQTVLALGLAGLLVEAIASHPAFAVSKVTLFKVVTPQNEIVIGLTRDELAKLEDKTADAVTKALNSAGQLQVWQYASRRGVSGELEEAPVRKVAVAADPDIRIEPYVTQLKVLPVSHDTMIDMTK